MLFRSSDIYDDQFGAPLFSSLVLLTLLDIVI